MRDYNKDQQSVLCYCNDLERLLVRLGVCLVCGDEQQDEVTTWASYQIRKIAGVHAPGMPRTFFPQVSDPDMHHGTCVKDVPLCMPGSPTSGFLWNRRRGKTFPTFPAHAQPAILRIWQEANESAFRSTGPLLGKKHWCFNWRVISLSYVPICIRDADAVRAIHEKAKLIIICLTHEIVTWFTFSFLFLLLKFISSKKYATLH